MLAEVKQLIEASESQLTAWKDARAAAERDTVEARKVNIST